MNEDRARPRQIRRTPSFGSGCQSWQLQSAIHKKRIFHETIIPLIAETNRAIPTSDGLRIFSLLIILIQLFLGGLFLLSKSAPIPYFIQKITQLIYIYSYDTKDGYLRYLSFVVNSAVFLFTFTLCFDFHRNNIFRPLLLYMFRIINGHLFNIFILPTLVSFFDSFATYGIKNSNINMLLVFLNLVASVHACSQIYFVTSLLEQNPYLQDLAITIWRSPNLYFLMIPCGLLFGFSRFDRIITNWAKLLPQIFSLTFCIIKLREYGTFNFRHVFVNAISYTYIIFFLISSAMNIVYTFMGLFNYFIYYGVVIGLTIIAYITIYFLYSKMIKDVKFNLSGFDKNGEMISQECLLGFFESLKINKYRSITYLVTGLEFGCPHFLNWNLPTFVLMKNPKDTSLLLWVTWASSIFPSETNFFNRCMSLCTKVKFPSYFFECYFYQLQQVYTFRQSASSNDSYSDYAEIKKKTANCIGFVSNFWKKIAFRDQMINVNTIYQISEMLRTTDNLWDQMMEKYPNHLEFLNLFSQYLLDAKSNFREAIKWHQKSFVLQSGHTLQTDLMLRSFLSQFPFYLKRTIIDLKGNVLQNVYTLPAPSYQVIVNEEKLSDSMTNSSIDYEEAESFLPDLHLRLILERVLRNFTSQTIVKMTFSSFARLALNTIYALIMFFLFWKMFYQKRILIDDFKEIDFISHSAVLTSHEIIWLFATSFPFVENGSSMHNLYTSSFGYFDYDLFYPKSMSLNDIVDNLSTNALNHLDVVTKWFYNEYHSANNLISRFTDIFSKEKFNDTICVITVEDSFIEKWKITTFAESLRSYLITNMRLTKDDNYTRQRWSADTDFCQVLLQNSILQKYFYETMGFLSSLVESVYGIAGSDNISQTSELILASVPFFTILFILPNIVYLTIGLQHEKEFSYSFLEKVEKEDALRASNTFFKKRITKSLLDKSSQFSIPIPKVNWRLILNMSLVVVILLMMVYHSDLAIQVNDKIDKLFEQSVLVFLLRNAAIDTGRDSASLTLFNSLIGKKVPHWVFNNATNSYEIVNSYYDVPFVFVKDVQKSLLEGIERYENLISYLRNGNAKVPSIYGFDPILDTFFLDYRCYPEIYYAKNSTIEFSKCISFDRLLSYYSSMIKMVNNSYFDMSIISSTVLDISHLIESRFAVQFAELMKLYFDAMMSRIDFFDDITITFFVFEIAAFVLLFFLEQTIIQSLVKELDAFKTLFLRLDPAYMINNPSLLRAITGAYPERRINSFGQAIYQMTEDAIIFVSDEFLIESFNPATNKIFGFASEQLYGQSISCLLKVDDNPNLYYTMKMMVSGQSIMYDKAIGFGTRDDMSKIRLNIGVIGFENQEQRASSLALVIKDTTEIDGQIAAVENAKRQADIILKQIIPKELHERYIRGENNIAFTVPSVTAIVVDIEKFSKYSMILEPTERMKNLSLVFSSFDRVCTLFPLITPVKQLGDCYLAIASIFTPELRPEIHAFQSIQFAMKCFQAVDELNMQINANLKIRIGIDTNGPLTVGLIGGKKPLFNVTGLPADVAFELQRTGKPGTIHISEGTYDHLATFNYNIIQSPPMNFPVVGDFRTYSIIQAETRESGKTESYLPDPDTYNQSFVNLAQMLSFSTFVHNSRWRNMNDNL